MKNILKNIGCLLVISICSVGYAQGLKTSLAQCGVSSLQLKTLLSKATPQKHSVTPKINLTKKLTTAQIVCLQQVTQQPLTLCFGTLYGIKICW